MLCLGLVFVMRVPPFWLCASPLPRPLLTRAWFSSGIAWHRSLASVCLSCPSFSFVCWRPSYLSVLFCLWLAYVFSYNSCLVDCCLVLRFLPEHGGYPFLFSLKKKCLVFCLVWGVGVPPICFLVLVDYVVLSACFASGSMPYPVVSLSHLFCFVSVRLFFFLYLPNHRRCMC